jgi:hypothetical protein
MKNRRNAIDIIGNIIRNIYLYSLYFIYLCLYYYSAKRKRQSEEAWRPPQPPCHLEFEGRVRRRVKERARERVRANSL